MRLPSMSRSLVVAAALGAAALPALLPSPTYAADVAGPATCYLADENGTIIEPRQEYTPREGAGGLPALPSPVVAGQYTLEVSAPAMNFDPDQPDLHFACQVFYSPLGKVRLVDADGTVHAAQSYGNDQNDPSRAALTALPALPDGYEIVPGQTIRGFDAAARTVDPNDPANARAVGVDTDIVIRKIAAQPTPEPSSSTPSTPTTPSTPSTPSTPTTPSTPSTPSTPATPATPAPQTPSTPSPRTPATPTPQTPAGVTPTAPTTPVRSTPAPSHGLAKTGSDAAVLAGAAGVLVLLGAGAIAVRRARA